jgi:hypothetical protein
METDYKAAVRAARKQLKDDFKRYRLSVKKAHLLRKQAILKFELKKLGVFDKQVPITHVERPAEKIKVRKAKK